MRRIAPSILVAVLAALVLAATAAAQAPAPVPLERACPRGIPSPLKERMVCGVVPVPLNHADPAAGTIQIAFIRIAAARPPAVPTGVILLGGGPGENIVGSVGALRPGAPLLLLARDRDLVLIDQRGIGESRPALECRATGPRLRLFSNQVVGCLDRLRAGGTDLSQYNTLNNARDLDLVRQAFGYQQVDLYGTSYGARLAHQALRGNPPWVRSVILASPYPPQVNAVAEAPASFSAALANTFRLCRAAPECNRRYPNLGPRLNAALRRLVREPLSFRVRDPRSGRMVTAKLDAGTAVALLFGLYYRPDVAVAAPRAIDALADGQVQRLVSGGSQVASAVAVTLGAQYAFLCQEEAAYYGAPPAARARRLPLAGQLLTLTSPSVGQPMLDICKRLRLPKADPVTFQRVTSPTPALIVAGQLDQITPPRDAVLTARDLPNSSLLTIPGVGHSPLNATGVCGITVLVSFLADPTAPPDTACLRRLTAQ